VFGDERNEQSHEPDRHRQAIPEQGRVVRRPVVVRGTEENEGGAGKQYEPRNGKSLEAACTPEQKSGDADDEERDVGSHVEHVRDAAEDAAIGEIVVREILRDRRPRKEEREHRQTDGDERNLAPSKAQRRDREVLRDCHGCPLSTLSFSNTMSRDRATKAGCRYTSLSWA
jgi:hypothetical protein